MKRKKRSTVSAAPKRRTKRKVPAGPKILVSYSGHKAGPAVAGMLYRAGAVAILRGRVNRWERVPRGIAGVVFCGGADIDPTRYGQEYDGAEFVDYDRDDYEFRIADWAYQYGLPMLGICRGMQLINVFFGGTLVQDIGEAHRNRNHAISVNRNAVVPAGNIGVNSYHHQMIDVCGDGIRIYGDAADDTPEVIQHRRYPAYGVQFHPEYVPESPVSKQIIGRFVDVVSAGQ